MTYMIQSIQSCGVKLLGLLLTGSTGQQVQVQVELAWPDIHWLASINGGLVADSVRLLRMTSEYAIGAHVESLWMGLPPTSAPR